MAPVAQTSSETARVRYMVNDIDAAVDFYTDHFGFKVERAVPPNFAMLSRGHLQLVLSTPFGPGGAAKPMRDGSKAEPLNLPEESAVRQGFDAAVPGTASSST